MHSLTREQSRRVDALAMENYGISGSVLMENAGRNVVDLLESLGVNGSSTVCCGKGNNGGDGFVIARHLLIRRKAVEIWLFAEPEALSGDAKTNYHIAQKLDIPIRRYTPEAETHFLTDLEDSTWVLDALLGTGAQGPPRSPVREGILAINRLHRETALKVLAIDIPSGLDADTGVPSDPTIEADHTCTFVAAKTGFAEESAKAALGVIHVLDIGFPNYAARKLLR